MDWTGIGTLATGLGTMGTAFVGWATRKKASEIHDAVQTKNGRPIGAQVDRLADAVLRWDGVDRRNSSGR